MVYRVYTDGNDNQRGFQYENLVINNLFFEGQFANYLIRDQGGAVITG